MPVPTGEADPSSSHPPKAFHTHWQVLGRVLTSLGCAWTSKGYRSPQNVTSTALCSAVLLAQQQSQTLLSHPRFQEQAGISITIKSKALLLAL